MTDNSQSLADSIWGMADLLRTDSKQSQYGRVTLSFTALRKDGDGNSIKPVTAIGQGQAHDPKTEKLSEIIRRLNELFGAETTDADKLRWFNSLRERVRENDIVMSQIKNNSPDQVMYGNFPKAVTDAVIDNLDAYGKLSSQFLNDSEVASYVMRLVLTSLS